MPDALGPAATGLAPRPTRDGALDAALERLAGDWRHSGPVSVPDVEAGASRDRADTPDLHVTAVRRLPAVPAQFAPFPASLDPRLQRALESRGISQLYTHQAEAIAHALAGRNAVVVTPTASGKTLCYNAPVLHAILQDPSSARALSVSDQGARAGSARRAPGDVRDVVATRRSAMLSDVPIGVFTYDGDTPQDARRTIRGRAHLVLSNPDMVHSGILPHHPRWAKLFENLRYVSSTSCTPTAASSAAICATCCGGCAASAGTTDPTRCSSARRRRSRIRRSSPSG